jgi:protein-S-isoprenylcysteine O-methyltransferase Ste14
MKIKALVGSGDKIMLLVLPFLIAGVILNVVFPSFFHAGGPPEALKIVSIVLIIPGVIGWLWSVALILSRVPQGKLITGGPFAIVKHPLYTSVALLVLPWLGFLLNTWLGAALGIVLYASSRIYSPAEETALAVAFGGRWEEYTRKVLIRWL